jgi:cellulose synthase/poly-beta-1,6-N-acetylglucosamine synthase-like glycosyltransferase
LFLLTLFWAILTVNLSQWLFLRSGFLRAVERSEHLLEPLPPEPISVVIAARNEEDALPRLLQSLTGQRHAPEGIIIVDDDSEDRTAEIVNTWRIAHPSINLISVDDPKHPRKKNALTHGIAASTTDLIAFTDADCAPGPGWTETLARAAAGISPRPLLISYSPFRTAPGSVNRFSRYETFLTGFLSAAAAGLGRPYMAVGRNMCYTRTLFDTVNGFEHSLESLSGDDDLFVQHVHREKAAEVVHLFAPAAYVPSNPPATWREWFLQKVRHTSAGRFYPRSVQMHLAAFQATNAAVWIAPLLLGWTGALILGIKLAVQGVILRDAERKLNDRGFVAALPLLDLGYVLYNLFVAPIGLLRMPKRW